MTESELQFFVSQVNTEPQNKTFTSAHMTLAMTKPTVAVYHTEVRERKTERQNAASIKYQTV